ncbi:MAG: exonuclease domain-containing protein [Mycoplasma sp.]
MNAFIIDFETANSQRCSACSIGIVEIKDGKIVNEWSFLFKPANGYFDRINIKIHGITPDMVKDKSTFKEIWNNGLSDLLNNKIVFAHNASFDMSVSRATLAAYGLQHLNLHYSCTMLISKKLWPNCENHKLNTLCAQG